MDGFLSIGCGGGGHHGASWSDTETVFTNKDAWVYEDTPTTNFGDSQDLVTGYAFTGGGNELDTYLHFDLSSIPPTATVVLAELWIHIWDTFNSYPTVYSLEAVLASWGESTITWNNQPTSTEMFTFGGPGEGFAGWYRITHPALTALVQDWVSGGLANEGLAIIPTLSTTSYDEIDVYSSESGDAPYLVVHYNP